MEKISKMTDIFKPVLGWNKARADLISSFIIALIMVRTVNLVEIASVMPGRAVRNSEYRRLKRFFADFEICFKSVAILIVRMLPIADQSWDIAMDRSDRKLGKKNINPLVMGIVFLNVVFPLRWKTFSKRGNSDTEERIAMTGWFISVSGVAKIRCLLADREFIGEKWFGYLLEKKIPFRIRIRENFKVTDSEGRPVCAKNLFRDLKPGHFKLLNGKRMVNGHRLYLIGMMLPDGNYLIPVTDKEPENALENYKRRWGIETLFQCLKGRGFNFEDTHITIPERINKLIALLAISFTWCHVTGQWRNEIKEIKIKKHGRKEVSLFRYGLDYLRGILLNISENRHRFYEIVRISLQPLLYQNIPLKTSE